MFSLTQAGYQFAVGKMTGTKATEHQIAYVRAFSACKAFIKSQRECLHYRYVEKDLEVKASQRRASIHGRGLNQRPLESLVLDPARKTLENLIQQSLLNQRHWIVTRPHSQLACASGPYLNWKMLSRQLSFDATASRHKERSPAAPMECWLVILQKMIPAMAIPAATDTTVATIPGIMNE